MSSENPLAALGGLKRRSQLKPEPKPETPKLQAVPEEPAPKEPSAPAEDVGAPEADAPEAAAGDIDPSPAAPAPEAGERVHTGNITLRIPTELMSWLEQHHDQTKISYPNIILNAVSWAHPRLGELLAREERPVPENDLFGRPATIPALRRGEAEYDTKPMKLRPEHLAVIDGIAAKWTNKNRTQLLITCLTAYKDHLQS